MSLASRSNRWLIAIGIVALLIALSGAVMGTAAARGNVGAPVRQSTTNHTIAVSGHGEVSVTPDEADITLGVQTKGQDAQTALSSNATRMSAVIAAVEAQNVSSSQVKTTDLSLYFDSESGVYVVQHSLSVHLDSVNKVGPVLDAAVAAGANNAWGVSFGVQNQSAARSQALQAAIADARQRANSMASALGVSVTGVGSASEASYSSSPPPFAPVAAQGVASTPIQPGTMTISADVNVVFTFG